MRIALSTFLATTVNFAFVSGEGTGDKPWSESFHWPKERGSFAQVCLPSLWSHCGLWRGVWLPPRWGIFWRATSQEIGSPVCDNLIWGPMTWVIARVNDDGNESSRANQWLEDEKMEMVYKKRKAHKAPSSLGVLRSVGVGALPNGPEPLCVRPNTSQSNHQVTKGVVFYLQALWPASKITNPK